MKYFIYAFILLLIGCNNDNNLTFDTTTIQDEICASCPKVAIQLPNAIDQTKFAKTINIALREEVISLLQYDDADEVSTIQSAITSFKNGYLELQKLYNDESTPWEATITGRVTFEDDNFLTIALDTYIFTGGAHGYTSKQFLNFDKQHALELENNELFENEEDFRSFVETQFRKKEKIPQDKPINATGFMFENDSFHLPENMGFDTEGLVLIYNPYEVASYADGTIEMTVSHSQVKQFLSIKPKS